MNAVPLTKAGAVTYGAAHQLVGARVIQLTVTNAAAYVQLGHGIGGQLFDDESYRLPGVHVIPGPLDSIRVRSVAAHTDTGTDLWPRYAIDAY